MRLLFDHFSSQGPSPVKRILNSSTDNLVYQQLLPALCELSVVHYVPLSRSLIKVLNCIGLVHHYRLASN